MADPLLQKLQKASKTLTQIANETSLASPNNPALSDLADDCFRLLSHCSRAADALPPRRRESLAAFAQTGLAHLKSLISAAKTEKAAAHKNTAPDAALKNCKNSAALVFSAGQCLRGGDYSEALGLYRRAVTADAAWARVAAFWEALGLTFLALENGPMARAALAKCGRLGGGLGAGGALLLAAWRGWFGAGEAAGPGEWVVRGKEGVAIFLETAKKEIKNEKGFSETIYKALMSDLHFYGNDFEMSSRLSEECIKDCANNVLKSHCLYQRARVAHVTKNYNTAYNMYKQSLSANKQNYNALFGFAQISLFFGKNLARSQSSLEMLIENFPAFAPAYKLLSFTLMAKNDLSASNKHLKTFLSLHPYDMEGNLLMSQLLEQSDVIGAIKHINRMVQILKNCGESVPLEIYNNLAVLYQKSFIFDQAALIYKNILKIEDLSKSDKIKTVKMNKICLDIDKGMKVKALKQYQKIDSDDREIKICAEITKHEIHHQALKKSGNSDLIKKNRSELCEKLSKLIEDPELNIFGFILAHFYYKNGQPDEAQKWLGSILAKEKDNALALTMLGNHSLDALSKTDPAVTDPAAENKYPSAAENAQSARKAHRTADRGRKAAYKKYFRPALCRGSNVFALNALGVLMAERGLFERAAAAFARAKDCDARQPVFWENLGHCYVRQGDNGNAVAAYEKAVALCGGGGKAAVRAGVGLARALFMSRGYERARGVLETIIKTTPDSIEAKYNLAVVMENQAVSTAIPLEKQTSQNFKESIDLLANSRQIFSDLAVRMESSETKEKAVCHFKYCEAQIRWFTERQKVFEKGAVEKRKILEQQEKQLVELRRKREEIQKSEENKRLDVERARNEKAIASVKRLEDIKEKWNLIEKELKVGQRKRKSVSSGKNGKKPEKPDSKKAKSGSSEKNGSNTETESDKSKRRIKKLSDKELIEIENEADMFENYFDKQSDDDLDFVPEAQSDEDAILDAGVEEDLE